MTAIEKSFFVQNICFDNNAPLAFILGPCQIESRDHAFFMAEKLTEIAQRLKIAFVYKSSFDKANRTSLSGQRGVGLEQALTIFADLKKEFSIPILTDIHSPEQCARLAEFVDILQIPAFLCRQTDLLIAAAKTNLPINVKKGQFLAPWDMKYVVDKIVANGNGRVLCCERGVSFGYNRLIVDMRSLPIMAELGTPVVLDATHSVQEPGGQAGRSGGQRQFVETIARAGVATKIAALFMETHQDPDNAPSDGPNMVRLSELEELLKRLIAIDALVKGF